jgi:transcriptional regulator with XRE-family HTH domain
MTMQAEQLSALREAMKMTQGELAEALGLTSQFIGMMERGEKPIEKRTGLAVRYLNFVTGGFPQPLKISPSEIDWQTEEGRWQSRIGEFTATLFPESRGRWSVSLRHNNGYSPPWPRWEKTLEGAKAAAILNAQQGLIDLATMNL